MSKRREKKPPVKQGAIENERSDRASTVTFSVRLTSSERALLADAAKFKGWTTTNLIKQAAIERAAHIINMATPRNFEFESLARLLAHHLSDPEIMISSEDDPEGAGERLKDFLEHVAQRLRVRGFRTLCESAVPLSKLREAARLGGVEFVARVLDEWDRLSASSASLPAPIDPAKLD